jgi:hypothetical protein
MSARAGDRLIGNEFRPHDGFRCEFPQVIPFPAFCVFFRDIDAGQYWRNGSNAAECNGSRNDRRSLDHLASPVVNERGRESGLHAAVRSRSNARHHDVSVNHSI